MNIHTVTYQKNITSYTLLHSLAFKIVESPQFILKFLVRIFITDDKNFVAVSSFCLAKQFSHKVAVVYMLWLTISSITRSPRTTSLWFDQISDHKRGIFLHENLSTKLLMQAANINTTFMFTKT